ncbi:MAG: response regulator [Candidatus Tectimicrobiota bacterium]
MSIATLPTALVINDDLTQLHLMTALLEKDGLHVLSCANAEDALRLLVNRGSVDVIVTDLHMPGIDGWRFCRLLRSPEYPALNTVPVLVVSATFSGTDTEQVTTDLGANGFLAVPYESATLRQNVRNLLAGRALQTARQALIVTTSPSQGMSLQRAFEAHGYTVSVVSSGMAAQQMLSNHTPAVLVLDYHLPDMSGDYLLKTFVRPGSPMVALVITDDATPELAVHCMRLGADGYVRTPFDPTYVLDLCLKARRSRALLRVEGLLEERTQKLRASEARFRLLFDSIPETVLVHDTHRRLLYVNALGAQWLGWPAVELLGAPLSQILVSSDDAAGEADSPEHRLHPGPQKTCYRSRSGQILEAEVSTCAIDFEGQPAFLSVARDITERTRLEMQLRQAHKMQAIGTLAGGIAHDFNNILAAILGYTELALYDVPPGSRTQRHLTEVLASGKRARDLVQQILAFSRQRPPERQQLQLHLLINDMLKMLRASLPSTIAIQPELSPSAGTVLGDPTQLQQVLMNLCTNAERAMRDTGGVLRIRLEATEVTPAFARAHPPLLPGPHVRLQVVDTGPGIPPELFERIFEPFFTTREVGEGTGLGLAVVDGIIANHGGAITVESAPGQGTTFSMYLPRLHDIALGPEVSPEPPIPGGMARILFVDDEATLAGMSAELLTHLGYHTTVYSSSPEALDAFRAAPQEFDLVITDQTMPGLTGEQLTQELRQIRPDIPIILCTGFSHTMTAEKARSLGVNAFLQKPLALRELALAIRAVLEGGQDNHLE